MIPGNIVFALFIIFLFIKYLLDFVIDPENANFISPWFIASINLSNMFKLSPDFPV